jgi:hypothetical protein
MLLSVQTLLQDVTKISSCSAHLSLGCLTNNRVWRHCHLLWLLLLTQLLQLLLLLLLLRSQLLLLRQRHRQSLVLLPLLLLLLLLLLLPAPFLRLLVWRLLQQLLAWL